MKDTEELKGLLLSKCIELDDLKKQCTALKIKYDTTIGKYQLEKFKIFFLCRKTKRKIELCQMYANQNRPVDHVAIEEKIEKETKDYMAYLEARKLDIQRSAILAKSPHCTPEEIKKIKIIYRKLAKKLHPDLNENTNQEEKNVWIQVMDAYQSNDLETLENLWLVYKDKQATPTQEDQDALETSIQDIQEKIEALYHEFPLNQKALLSDPAQIDFVINQLKREIEQINQTLGQLKKYINIHFESEIVLS